MDIKNLIVSPCLIYTQARLWKIIHKPVGLIAYIILSINIMCHQFFPVELLMVKLLYIRIFELDRIKYIFRILNVRGDRKVLMINAINI